MPILALKRNYLKPLICLGQTWNRQIIIWFGLVQNILSKKNTMNTKDMGKNLYFTNNQVEL